MAGIQIADARAPWIMFERRAVEDRNRTIEEGRYVAKDVDFVLVTPHGSKDQIEAEVEDWFTRNRQQVNEGRLDANWQAAYENAYKNWKAGKEIPLEGTPIINWPLVSPAQVKMLQDIHILTVESLAHANEEAIRRMGMGGRNLVQKANEFLKQASGAGKSTEQIVSLQATVESLKAMIQAQAETIAALSAQRSQAQTPAPENFGGSGDGSGIGAGDLLDDKTSTLKKL